MSDTKDVVKNTLRNKYLSPKKAVAEYGGVVTIVGLTYQVTKYSNGEALPVFTIKEGGLSYLYGSCYALKQIAEDLVQFYGEDMEALNAALAASPVKLKIGNVVMKGTKQFRPVELVEE